jgi:hypothetical protein
MRLTEAFVLRMESPDLFHAGIVDSKHNLITDEDNNWIMFGSQNNYQNQILSIFFVLWR